MGNSPAGVISGQRVSHFEPEKNAGVIAGRSLFAEQHLFQEIRHLGQFAIVSLYFTLLNAQANVAFSPEDLSSSSSPIHALIVWKRGTTNLSHGGCILLVWVLNADLWGLWLVPDCNLLLVELCYVKCWRLSCRELHIMTSHFAHVVDKFVNNNIHLVI